MAWARPLAVDGMKWDWIFHRQSWSGLLMVLNIVKERTQGYSQTMAFIPRGMDFP